ncbi:MAG: hypothetical protein QOK11_2976 [Pseudonocardiales bacterium]|nr:hypothetical protein [Pseudonocardiales bacterium]
MDLDAAADELYGLVPDRFTARRTELATEARSAGEADLAKEIGKLRRPTVVAWIVNALVRTHPGEIDRLLGLGDELRAAQRDLAGDAMRELSAQRRTVVADLVGLARSEAAGAGHRAGDGTLREVQATLDAALADRNAGAAVRSGRLITALSYSGFGEVDLSDAVAAPSARPRLSVVRSPAKEATAGKATAGKATAGKATAAKAAERAELTEARRVADKRAREAETARAALDKATKRRDELAANVAHLDKQLERERHSLRNADTELRAAKQKHDAAHRAADRTAQRLRAAEKQNR